MSRKSSSLDCINDPASGPDEQLLNSAQALCDPDNTSWCEICFHTLIKQEREGLSQSEPSLRNQESLELIEIK